MFGEYASNYDEAIYKVSLYDRHKIILEYQFGSQEVAWMC